MVVEVGADAGGFAVGDRVAYLAMGTYAERTAVPARSAIRLPDAISSKTAAASLLQGVRACSVR